MRKEEKKRIFSQQGTLRLPVKDVSMLSDEDHFNAKSSTTGHEQT